MTENYPQQLAGFLKLDGAALGLITEDISSVTGRDWQLAFNDLGTGEEYFAVFDLGSSGGSTGAAVTGDASSVPFRIDAGAPDNSVRVLQSGRVGMGTATPTQELEIVSSSPTIRLVDLDGSAQWNLNDSPQGFAFDIVSSAGATSVRHFFIDRAAPADQLMLTPTGIGIGTLTPSATMEIEGSSGTSQLLIDEQGADANVEIMFNLVCNCAPAFRMTNTTNGKVWFFRHTSGGDFSFDDPQSAGLEARLDSSGNFFLKGTLSQGSSRALKENLEPANGTKVLKMLDQLDLYEWSYIDQSGRHFGPMAEDFSAAYGLGESRAKIAPADMAGVALASAKALREENTGLKAENASQQEELRSLLEQLRSLLGRVTALENVLN